MSGGPAEVRLVAAEGFAEAARVTIGSFRDHHPAFRGPVEVVVATDEVSSATTTLGDVARVRAVSAETARLARELARRTGGVAARFYKLDLFASPPAGATALLLDADVSFHAPVDDLLARHGPLVAAADGPGHRGLVTDRISNVPREPGDPATTPGGDDLATFNSGVMLVAASELGATALTGILRRAAEIRWELVERLQHDQLVLNRHFAGRWVEAPPTVNFLLRHHLAITQATGITLPDAAVVHHNVEPRPWDDATHPDPLVAECARRWREIAGRHTAGSGPRPAPRTPIRR